MLLKTKIGSFRYVPHYGGNRDLPDAERMSFMLRPVTRLERLAQLKWGDADELTAWRNEALAELLKADYGPLIPQLPTNLQASMRQFVEHVSEPQNVAIEDETGEPRTLTDPGEIYLELIQEDWESTAKRIERTGSASGFTDPEDASKCGLVAEIQYVLGQTAELSGDELKNFPSLCAGSSQRTAEIAEDAPETDAPDPVST